LKMGSGKVLVGRLDFEDMRKKFAIMKEVVIYTVLELQVRVLVIQVMRVTYASRAYVCSWIPGVA